MPAWEPSSGPQAARSRAALLQRIRQYFAQQDVLEVDTPALSPAAVSDPQIETIEARTALSPGPLYLHTSPEFAMKRLLAGGYPDIYSICRVFRDGEAGRHHQPEFTMLEWYRHDFTLSDIVSDTVAAIAAALNRTALCNNARIVDYYAAIDAATGLDAANASTRRLGDAVNADASLRTSIGDARDDWLDLILAQRVIPGFECDRLTVLRHYPASQAALARHCPADPSVADRFEVFLGPIELANGYVELTDAAEQQRRFEADQSERRARGRRVRPLDNALLAALEYGLPPCAGVAMGVERLQMITAGTDDIRDVITFAFGDCND